ncbi:hypothetical protein A3D05_04910 [Candidatus Gottesmanbacteria bacterium RIFCSPHIGHO2_02_FULL_40_24]|uniref:Glycosyl transferase family 1 domain-containing protein n=1 Tax=Candidatus Gottesmanbacteria bacterium RIFCSPHIGHO2_01_FULL_40_15 TaxID=1798376 RepID=A0A1F5Z306_9BACT|nr:MAG: hypothetical protein A2777_05940 [Candidatus Gottesmanbacteria bacterium RIFCSPHIGHO2_01_FULL_40_15]OGG16211.1 MAG: hypothetical protein A3D05_04910 [Candidatus Gottesmanbacteria bacterium RIFCSPHIGHO2_02_FULL_40_24]OGG25879.1 MAG: hypothetical protein A3E42_06185 [Candidatus Gottesmanbacteria bacterium RIFCSPHIGHO2_12_FULL_40_13]OGG32294.1 MAG: hypothetical protein A3I80_03250 [Candidatus Gottesmanbacteria bacterium RIFCSPLOWO2_02_FULL_40_10]
MKLAIVYDRVVKFGGAERILMALHEIWPNAPLYTAVYRPEKAPWARRFHIRSSFLDHIPYAENIIEVLPFFTPYAFENFNFDEYDIVISITSQDAKSIITKPQTFHVCYCLTPTRYLWSGLNEYYNQPAAGIFNPGVRLGMKLFVNKLRRWDKISSKRPDSYLSISKTVKRRIAAYYNRESKVIYPPVDTEVFNLPKVKTLNDYFLIVSRLVPYKRVDYAIEAFSQLPYRLKIIGSGIDEKRLKKNAGKNIEFIGSDLTDRKLGWYYQNCLALIFPGEEDFGLTAVEAQACGRPVIALGKSGTTETVINGKTGLFYDEKSADSLISAVRKFFKYSFNPENCRQNSLRYSKKQFKQLMKSEIENIRQNLKSV